MEKSNEHNTPIAAINPSTNSYNVYHLHPSKGIQNLIVITFDGVGFSDYKKEHLQ